MAEGEKKTTPSMNVGSSIVTVSVARHSVLSFFIVLQITISLGFLVGREKTGRLMCLVEAAGLIDDVIIVVPDGKTHLWIDS